KDSDLGYYYVDVFQERQSVRSRRALLQISLADADNRLIQGFAVDKFADALNRQSSTGGGIHSLSGTAFTPVIGYTGTQIFSTVGFGGEPGELSHCGIPGGSSAWFTFIAPTNGRLYLDTSGSSFNTVLAVYTGPGPTITNLTALICDNDSGPGTTSSLNFSAAKNVTYYIAVDGFNGVTGTAHLNYRLLVPMTLSRVLKTNDTDCRLRVTATPSYPLTIQRCSGFQTWANVITITNPGSGTYDYRDTNATIIRRFYRAIQTP
ncbi:MAG TPA: PPC domain-containing protein, partial [Verrucomicrobiae bacterium]|nr:PPC domain-containing protein [Verrucomicrobiae bacterium]